MVSGIYGKRAAGWVAGVALAAMVAGVTGCSSDSGSDADEKPAASSSTAEDSKEEEKKDDSAASDSSATQQATAEEAVATWVTGIITENPEAACLVMATPAKDSSPAQVATKEMCSSDSAQGKTMLDYLGKFSESFTPKPAPSDPKVEVAQIAATGDTVEVPSTEITIDGQALDKIIVANSTGVEQGQVGINVESSKIEDAWYVTNVDFAIG